MAGPRHVLHRIRRAAIFQYFKMHVGSGGPARTAHQRHYLGFLNQVTDFYTHGFSMGVAGNQTIAMGDFHQIAIATTFAGPSNNARGHRNNVTAVFACQIDAAMPGAFATERIRAIAILG